MSRIVFSFDWGFVLRCDLKVEFNTKSEQIKPMIFRFSDDLELKSTYFINFRIENNLYNRLAKTQVF
jgi:hypothetical protein